MRAKRICWAVFGVALLLAVSVSASAATDTYSVVWPRGPKSVTISPVAERLDTLEGKTICEVWDWLFRGDEVFPMLEQALAERYPGLTFISYKEFGSTHGKEERQVLTSFKEKFAKYGCDAVISGVGC